MKRSGQCARDGSNEKIDVKIDAWPTVTAKKKDGSNRGCVDF